MRSDDMYPSTFDVLPPIAGGQEDPVLKCLITARSRVRSHWTRTAYVSFDGAVCAYGGVAAALLGAPQRLSGKSAWRKFLESEEDAARVAREAIELLNKAAVELYPESADYDDEYLGPIEYVNQVFQIDYARDAVLDCYDRAVMERRGMVPA